MGHSTQLELAVERPQSQKMKVIRKMPNKKIPDWKIAVISVMKAKYGDRAIGNKLGISTNTVKKYRRQMENSEMIETSGRKLKV